MSIAPDDFNSLDLALKSQAVRFEKMKAALEHSYPRVTNQTDIMNVCREKVQECYKAILVSLEKYQSGGESTMVDLRLLTESEIPTPTIEAKNSSINGNEIFYISKYRSDIWSKTIQPINQWISGLNEIQQALLIDGGHPHQHTSALTTQLIEKLKDEMQTLEFQAEKAVSPSRFKK